MPTNRFGDHSSSGHLSRILDDKTPQLGGMLDGNGFTFNGAVAFEAQAGEALSKGNAVYVSGVSGNKPVVMKADADNAAKMPAFGIAETDANLHANVNVVTFGTVYEIDTSAYAAGDELYVSTTPGELTATKPSGATAKLQNIGKVIRSHASAGSIKVGGAGRTNAVPNLDDGTVFIGDVNNQAEQRALVLADISDYTPPTETDPVYTASSWYTTTNNSSNWDTAYGWGDHASAGYYVNNIANNLSTNRITFANNETTAVTSDGHLAFDLNDAGAGASLGTYGSTHPSGWYFYSGGNLGRFWTDEHFSGTNIANWQTAYGWGDHSTQNYAVTTGDTFTGDITLASQDAKIIFGESGGAYGGPHGFDFYDSDGTLKWGVYYRTTPDTITWELSGTTPKLTLDTTGNLTAIGTVTAPTIRLTDQTDVSLSSTGHAFQIGPTSGLNIAADGNEIAARNNGAASMLYLNQDGGAVYINGAAVTSTKIGQWNTAYGWGDHGTEGYLLASLSAGTGTISVGIEDDYWRWRMGGTSAPQGIRLDAYDVPVFTVTRAGNLTTAGTITSDDALGTTTISGAGVSINRSIAYVGTASSGQQLRMQTDNFTIWNQGNTTQEMQVTPSAINLYNNTSVTGTIFSSGQIASGTSGSGMVALTTNDGGGNANVTFNHANNAPDHAGYNTGRITVNVDSTSGAYMDFRVANAGAAPASELAIFPGKAQVTNRLDLTNANLQLSQNGSQLRVTTASGYGGFGPQNTSWCHFTTDRARFYFDREVQVDGTGIRGYDTSTDCRFPIFYDLNDTNYYLNPNSTSRLHKLMLTGTGSINDAAVNGLQASSAYLDLYCNTTAGGGLRLFDNQGTKSVTVYQDGGGGGGFLDNDGHWSFRARTGTTATEIRCDNNNELLVYTSYVRAVGSFRAPIFYDFNNTSYYAHLDSTGDSIRAAGDIVAYYSDERLKDIEGNIPNALEKVCSLNGFYYRGNKKAQALGYDDSLKVGLSAQEVKEVLPEIIKDCPADARYMTVDYAKVVPLLVEAIKDLKAEIEELKK